MPHSQLLTAELAAAQAGWAPWRRVGPDWHGYPFTCREVSKCYRHSGLALPHRGPSAPTSTLCFAGVEAMVRVFPGSISRPDRGTDLGSVGVNVPDGLGFFACCQGRNLVRDCCSANRAMVAPCLARPLAYWRASASAASRQACGMLMPSGGRDVLGEAGGGRKCGGVMQPPQAPGYCHADCRCPPPVRSPP
jgi:hypothetical protein